MFKQAQQYGVTNSLQVRAQRHLLKTVNKPIYGYITIQLKARITDSLHAAIGSFAYNCGTGALQRSTFRQYINQGRYEDASNELPRWCRAGGKKIAGLLRRRYAERELFLS